MENEIVCQFMNIMFNAYKCGSKFAKNLWMEIIKTYYKWIYNLLKKYSHLKAEDIYHLTIDIEHDNTESLYTMQASFLVIAEMMDIELDENCAFIYYMLNELIEEQVDSNIEFIKKIELSDESSDTAEKWISDYESQYGVPSDWADTRMRGYRKLDITKKLSYNAFRLMGFGENFAQVSLQGDFLPKECIEWSASILKEIYPNKSFTDDEIVSYAIIVNIVFSYASTVVGVANFMDVFLGMKTNNADNVFQQYAYDQEHLDKIRKNISVNHVEDEEEAFVTKSLAESALKDEDNSLLLSEIDRLRLELHKKESENRYIKSLYADKLKSKDSYDKLLEKYEDEHIELCAIRNHLYSFTNQDISEEYTDYELILKQLQSYKVVIIGGHDNWLKKLGEIFPKWKYVKPGLSDSIDSSIICKADFVYFFTDCLDHKTYYKYISTIRVQKKRFGYIHSVNIENNIKQFKEELM